MIIKKDKELLVSYSGDASNFSGNPDVLFIPENINELRKCVKNCYLKKIPFTISGAGTGLTGGRVALSGACISSEKLNRIIEINFEQQYIIVEPGVLLKDVEEELSKIGFFLPPNPTEKNCTIGGNAATNASGSRTFKYGSFRDYILQLKIILPNGEETHLRRSCDVVNSDKLLITTLNNITFEINFEALNIPNVKHSAGYYLKQGIEPIDLFIGSEGTLGVISEIKLKIFNSSGDLVLAKDIGNFNIGKYSLTLNLEGQSTGSYYCTMEVGKRKITRKILLVK